MLLAESIAAKSASRIGCVRQVCKIWMAMQSGQKSQYPLTQQSTRSKGCVSLWCSFFNCSFISSLPIFSRQGWQRSTQSPRKFGSALHPRQMQRGCPKPLPPPHPLQPNWCPSSRVFTSSGCRFCPRPLSGILAHLPVSSTEFFSQLKWWFSCAEDFSTQVTQAKWVPCSQQSQQQGKARAAWHSQQVGSSWQGTSTVLTALTFSSTPYSPSNSFFTFSIVASSCSKAYTYTDDFCERTPLSRVVSTSPFTQSSSEASKVDLMKSLVRSAANFQFFLTSVTAWAGAAGASSSSFSCAMSWLMRSSRLMELGWPRKLILPNLLTRQTKGIPLIEKSLISLCSPFHPIRVRCWILVHPLPLTRAAMTSFCSSTLTATMRTFPAQPASFLASISWLCCIGRWQGPHQVAQTSTSSTSPASCRSCVFPSSKTLSIYPQSPKAPPSGRAWVISAGMPSSSIVVMMALNFSSGTRLLMVPSTNFLCRSQGSAFPGRFSITKMFFSSREASEPASCYLRIDRTCSMDMLLIIKGIQKEYLQLIIFECLSISDEIGKRSSAGESRAGDGRKLALFVPDAVPLGSARRITNSGAQGQLASKAHCIVNYLTREITATFSFRNASMPKINETPKFTAKPPKSHDKRVEDHLSITPGSAQQQFSIFLFSRHSCAQSSTSMSSKLGRNLRPSNSQIRLQNLKLPSTRTSLQRLSMSRMYLRQSSWVLLVAEPKRLRPRGLLSVSAVSRISLRMRFIFSCSASIRVPNSASSACLERRSRGRAMRSTSRRLYSSSIILSASSSGLFSEISSEARRRPRPDRTCSCFDINQLQNRDRLPCLSSHKGALCFLAPNSPVSPLCPSL